MIFALFVAVVFATVVVYLRESLMHAVVRRELFQHLLDAHVGRYLIETKDLRPMVSYNREDHFKHALEEMMKADHIKTRKSWPNGKVADSPLVELTEHGLRYAKDLGIEPTKR